MSAKWIALLLAVLVAGAGLLAFLGNRAEPAQPQGVVVVSATPTAAPSVPVPERPTPVLVRVIVNGASSVATFRLADSAERPVGVGQALYPDWILRKLDTGSATFDTPTGERRIALSAPPVVEETPRARTVVIPETHAKSADGEAVERCSDPEC